MQATKGQQWAETRFRAFIERVTSPIFVGVVVLIYLSTPNPPETGDTVPARYLPISILREFNVDLDEFSFLYDERGRQRYPFIGETPYFLRYRDGHYFSVYPVGPALLALPVYVLPVLAGMSSTSDWVPKLEKLSAALITAVSVLFLFWTLRELTSKGWALIIAGIYAFGTSSFSISCQALWQHGPSQLFLAFSLYLLVKGIRESWLVPYAGFTLTSSVLMRPTDALMVLPMAFYLIHRYRSARLMKCLLFALPPMAFFLYENYRYFGSLGGGHGPQTLDATSFFWRTPFFEGISGLLLSPGRGLFIYSPILVLSMVGIGIVWYRGPLLLRYISIGPLLVMLLYAKWFMWWGGWSYGPRLLADLAPILCLFLYPLCPRMKGRGALSACFVILALFSVGAHTLGAFWYDHKWDAMMDTDRHPERMWHLRNSPLVYYATQSLNGPRRALSHVAIQLLDLPTSLNSPQLLAASYRFNGLTSGASVQPYPCGMIPLSVNAVNVGKSVWLVHGEQNRGAVQLEWRWFWRGTEVPGLLGRVALQYDVFPGQQYEFTASIPPPAWPEEYILEVGLINTSGRRFSEQGIEPIQVAVHVVNSMSGDFDKLLATQAETSNDPLQLAITTDRPRYRHTDILHVLINLANVNRRHTVDAYIALAWPDGRLSFRSSTGFLTHPKGSWIPLITGVDLLQGEHLSKHSLLDLELVDLPSGCFGLYLILTESNTSAVIAKSQTFFMLEP
jgi:hypothetical protein